MPDISDYDKSGYDYTKYWKDRQYEDLIEKKVLKRLIPQSGRHLLDLGGSYGRFMPIYAPLYEQTTILDYSALALQQAAEFAEENAIDNLQVVQGDAYQTPFKEAEFDTIIIIRVLHHIEDLPRLFKEIHRILEPKGTLIIEFANKIHLKALLRNWARGNFKFRQDQTPLQHATTKIMQETGIFYNFHPQMIITRLNEAGFSIETSVSVSNLRLPPRLKRLIPASLLVRLDQIIAPIFTHFYGGPSIWFKCRKSGFLSESAS